MFVPRVVIRNRLSRHNRFVQDTDELLRWIWKRCSFSLLINSIIDLQIDTVPERNSP